MNAVWNSMSSLTQNCKDANNPFKVVSEKESHLTLDSIYASGDRTDKGIVGILRGKLSQPAASIVKNPAKAAKLPMLRKTFSTNKYHTSFFMAVNWSLPI